jgi:hypothetical protein
MNQKTCHALRRIVRASTPEGEPFNDKHYKMLKKDWKRTPWHLRNPIMKVWQASAQRMSEIMNQSKTATEGAQ